MKISRGGHKAPLASPPAEHTVAWQAAAVLQFGMKPAAIYQLLMIEGNGFGEEGFEEVD